MIDKKKVAKTMRLPSAKYTHFAKHNSTFTAQTRTR